MTHTHRQTQTQCKWVGGGRRRRWQCVTCLTICTPRLGHIPFQIVVIEGIAMWQIPKYPVTISVSLRCVLLLLVVVATQLSAAWLGLDQLSFPLNLFFRWAMAMASLGFVLSPSYPSPPLSPSLSLAWQLNCLKKVDTQDEAELALYWLLLFAILPSLVPSFLCLPASACTVSWFDINSIRNPFLV